MPQLKIRKKRGVAVLTLVAVPACDGLVREAITALTQTGCRHAVLDLGCAAPELSLVKPLLTLRRRVQRKKGRLILCGLSSETADWLRATWLLGLFEMRPDVNSALACLNGHAK
jgi:hypothetical protein